MPKPLFGKAEKLMESTDPAQPVIPHQRPWLSLRYDKEVVPGRVWAFTDGSTTGWHAATIIRPGVEVRYFADHGPPCMANVGAEMNGLILALKNLPEGQSCNIVHDYMGVGAWLVGAWTTNKPESAQKVDEAKAVIRARKLQLHFIHHGGHQVDDSDFTYWNNVTDRHCSLGAVLNIVQPWDQAMADRNRALERARGCS